MPRNTTEVPNRIRIIDFDDELLLLVSPAVTHIPLNHHLSNGKTYVVLPSTIQSTGIETSLIPSFAGARVLGLEDVVGRGGGELEDDRVADFGVCRGGGEVVAFFADYDCVCGCCSRG